MTPISEGFFLCIDKPVGMTSHDVVAMMRFFLRTRKIGHTGTLDPFATGVLVLAIGSATKLIQYIPEAPKMYEMRLQLGMETETADCDGDLVRRAKVPYFSTNDIQNLAEQFTGRIAQKPPLYSAFKVKGKRLYEYARAGIPVVDRQPGLRQRRRTCGPQRSRGRGFPHAAGSALHKPEN